MRVFYLKRERFTKGDTTTALKFAFNLAKKDSDIDTISLLVLQQQQYEPFLGEVGFKPIHFKNHLTNVAGYNIQIHTVNTYHPSYQSQGHPQSEILVAIGVPPKDLERFEDCSNIKYWILVPWLMNENTELLSIFEAEDLETGQRIAAPNAADVRIVNAIGWLKRTSYPNEGYHHPLDEDRLHQMANAIKHYEIPFDYASTVYCGLHHGLIPSAARRTAEAFSKAQGRAFAIKHDHYDFPFLKKMMDTDHDQD